MNAMQQEIDPADVYSGSITQGEIHVRAFRDRMPDSGTRMMFAGYTWIVTRRNVPTAGGRSCYVALRLLTDA